MFWVTQYSCPHCNTKYSDSEIAEIYFTRECPECLNSINIDAKKALTKTYKAFEARFLGFFISASIIGGIADSFSVGKSKIFTIFFLIILVPLCFYVPGLSSKLYANRSIKSAHKRFPNIRAVANEADVVEKEADTTSFCPRCKTQYRDGFEICSDCKLRLVKYNSNK